MGQLSRGRAHIHLSRDHMSDQACAILLHELALPAGVVDGVVEGGRGLVEVGGDDGLFGKRREGNANVFKKFLTEVRLSPSLSK